MRHSEYFKKNEPEAMEREVSGKCVYGEGTGMQINIVVATSCCICQEKVFSLRYKA
jgi:hypothetical protein